MAVSETCIVSAWGPKTWWVLRLLCSLSPLPTAQVEVLSAALRASSLDAHEETTGGVEQRSELRDEVGVSELPDCNISQDTSVPLISAAEEVISSRVCQMRAV